MKAHHIAVNKGLENTYVPLTEKYQKSIQTMKKSIIIILAAIPIVVSSCASSRFFSQSASDIRPIALVEPFAYITDAIGDLPTKYLDDASRINQKLVAEIVTSMGLPVEKAIPMEHHSKVSAQTDEWMRKIGDRGAGAARALKIPDAIRDAVSKSGCRYGLLITDLGYLKDPDMYAFEQALDASTRVMDAVLYHNVNLSSDAEAYLNGVFGLIFDSTTGNVVWYGAQPRRYKKSPVDQRTLSEQLQALFKDFR